MLVKKITGVVLLAKQTRVLKKKKRKKITGALYKRKRGGMGREVHEGGDICIRMANS